MGGGGGAQVDVVMNTRSPGSQLQTVVQNVTKKIEITST